MGRRGNDGVERGRVSGDEQGISRLNVQESGRRNNEEWFPEVQSVYDHRVAILDGSP